MVLFVCMATAGLLTTRNIDATRDASDTAHRERALLVTDVGLADAVVRAASGERTFTATGTAGDAEWSSSASPEGYGVRVAVTGDSAGRVRRISALAVVRDGIWQSVDWREISPP